MGFDKFPHIPGLKQMIERHVVESIVHWIGSTKQGFPPQSAALDAALCRKIFPHMFPAYVIKITGSLHRCHSDSDAASLTLTAIQSSAGSDGFDVSHYSYAGHRACVACPGATLKARYRDERTKLGYAIPTDPLHDAYIFDPWSEKGANVYFIQTWESSFGKAASGAGCGPGLRVPPYRMGP